VAGGSGAPGGAAAEGGTMMVPPKVAIEFKAYSEASRGRWSRHIMVRLADEGVPIGAIVRVTKQPPELVREVLRDAAEQGIIFSVPRDDWPVGSRRHERVPDVVPIGVDDERMLVAAMRKLRTTQAESAILVAFLKRTHVSKGSLHMLITRDQSKPPSVKLVDVMICKLRKKLPDGVKIENLWGVGYYITSDAKQTILAYLQVDS